MIEFSICQLEGCRNEFIASQNKYGDFCSKICLESQKSINKKQKARKSLKNVSPKRELENEQYKALRLEFLSRPENKICPIMKIETTDIHHKKGRVGKLFLDTNFWIALSREGHRTVEGNPDWAKEQGYSLNRLDND
jgi:hypothetical protein